MMYNEEVYMSTKTEKDNKKSQLIEFMEQNDIKYNLIECCESERFCINFNNQEEICKKYCCNSAITAQTIRKDVVKFYPHEILYITIDSRKSVIYLTDRKIETHYPIDYWIDILDKKIFAQPHYSYIVNMNYVDTATKDFVTLKYGDDEYKIYTSMRKIRAFKKALLNFGNQ